MATKPNDDTETLARANAELREAVLHCRALLERTQKMLERYRVNQQR